MRPLQPAQLRFGPTPESPPEAPAYGDVYHPRIGAAAQARHVFLQGNGLPGRWQGRSDFTVLETGFGLGHNLLALLRAWRADPQRCTRLHLVSVELHPPRRGDLARAHGLEGGAAAVDVDEDLAALLAQWPPLSPGLHRLHFASGAVQLTLALGDAGELLPALRLRADAVLLDGFAPARNPALWSAPLLKAVGRACAPGATAATWSVARSVREGLATAGFEVQTVPGIGGKREVLRALHRPRPHERRLPWPAVAAREAVVVGAGLAGAAAAQALAARGLRVTVLERAPAPAQGASGNPAGLFHGTFDADDSPHARLYRAAALWAERVFRAAVAAGVPGAVDGLLRTGMRADAASLEGYVALLDPTTASARAGVPVATPSALYPGGGWLDPGAWVRHALATPGVTVRTGVAVQRLQRSPAQGDAPGPWQLLGADGGVLAETPLVVLAAAAELGPLLAPLGLGVGTLRLSRGQVTHWRRPVAAGCEPLPRVPLAGDGYAIALPGRLLCGATRQGGDTDPAVREADHAYNLERFTRLTGLAPPAPAACEGRVGWRVAVDDRLPVAGAVAVAAQPRTTQCRLLAREPGLFVLGALGARGLTLAPLLGELLAAQALGTPWPLEQDLVDAVDPGRWQVRAWREGGAA